MVESSVRDCFRSLCDVSCESARKGTCTRHSGYPRVSWPHCCVCSRISVTSLAVKLESSVYESSTLLVIASLPLFDPVTIISLRTSCITSSKDGRLSAISFQLPSPAPTGARLCCLRAFEAELALREQRNLLINSLVHPDFFRREQKVLLR